MAVEELGMESGFTTNPSPLTKLFSLRIVIAVSVLVLLIVLVGTIIGVTTTGSGNFEEG